MLVVMVSFALAFYALFNTCAVDSDILAAYGTFGTSLLAMFKAMLGGKWGEAIGSVLMHGDGGEAGPGFGKQHTILRWPRRRTHAMIGGRGDT